MAALFFALPGFVSWSLTLRKQGENDLDLLLFSALFASAPLLSLILLSIFRRWWLVTLALPTTLLNAGLCLVMKPSAVTWSFVAAIVFVAIAFARAFVGRPRSS